MTGPSWHDSSHPELRPGPPWVMEEMIAAQPSLAEPMLGVELDGARGVADALAGAVRRGETVVVTGCGTSEHGAQAIAALLRRAVDTGPGPPAVIARSALDEAVDPLASGLCLGVSHDGGTRATTLALEAARERGVAAALVTARPDGAAAAAADAVIATPLVDRSWCHTVAYVSAILAGAAIARELGLLGVAPAPVEALLARHAELAERAREPARRLAGLRTIVAAGSGTDHVTARELALKVAEGSRQATVAFDVETVLHGHLAGHDATSGILIAALAPHPRVARRAALVAAAAGAIGMPVAAVLPDNAALAPGSTTAGRLVVEPPADLDRTLGALLAGALALQVLTVALAHERGVNPDLIRREEAPYREAGRVADADW